MNEGASKESSRYPEKPDQIGQSVGCPVHSGFTVRVHITGGYSIVFVEQFILGAGKGGAERWPSIARVYSRSNSFTYPTVVSFEARVTSALEAIIFVKATVVIH